MVKQVGRTFELRSLVSLVTIALMVTMAACSSTEVPRQYSDEELGLEELVNNEIVLSTLPFTQFRTIEEMDRALVDPATGSGHERERNYFEHLVVLVMLGADDTLPPDVAIGSGVLHDAKEEAMDACAAEAGWPGVQLYDVSQQCGEQYEREFGLTVEIFLDLRHGGAK